MLSDESEVASDCWSHYVYADASDVQILSLTQKFSATRHIAKVSSLIIYRSK
jgi:hypothetical protein